MISSLVTRAIKFSSSWQGCSSELERLKQTLANNGYPQSMVEGIIGKKLNLLLVPEDNVNNADNQDVTFYVNMRNLSYFTAGTKDIKSIVDSHVKNSLPGQKVKVLTYYRPHKLSSQFTTRCGGDRLDRSCVVYSFECPIETCNGSYYGHTTQHLSNRIKQHRYAASSIAKHYHNDHDMVVSSSFLRTLALFIRLVKQ